MKALFAALALLFAGPAAAAVPEHRATVVESPDGWTFGRPGAPLLAEYASFGCPHCRQFAEATSEQIDRLIRTGKLRFAFRPFLIFPQDRAATTLARCIAPRRRLGFIKAALLGQADIRARLVEAVRDEAVRGRLYAAELEGPQALAKVLAEVGGLAELAAAHGLGPAAQQSCLASAQNGQWVTDADANARLTGIKGTPTYVWRGKTLPEGTPGDLIALLPR